MISTVVLCLIGAFSIYAATRDSGAALGTHGGAAYLKRDAINLIVGLVLASPVLTVGYRTLLTVAPVLYGGVVLSLMAVLTPLGARINGAHGWFRLGPVQLEPSEFAKLAIILLIAGLLTEYRDGETEPAPADIALALAAVAVPALLVLVEPALGVAIMLGSIAVAALALAGARGVWIGGLIAGSLLAGTLAIQLHLLKPYQEQRFTFLASPTGAASSSTGYQIRQSRIAIGAGGLTGQGFLAGTQTNGGFIPEQQTDFVFTVVAEESGFVGAAALLLALGGLLWSGLTIAQRAPDLYGRVVAGSIVMWFAFQSFVNIGMTTGIMPVTGLPLPFISYGGSALFADLLAVALLLNIARAGRTST
ncbi:MAG: rod shape-determining protein RodA [Mycobacteriales bacterium]